MPFRPRYSRDEIRGNAAFAAARASGLSALDAALAAIEAQFGTASVINGDKLRVQRWLEKSFGHQEVRARFAYHIERIAALGLSLDQACALLRAECAERRIERIRLPSMVRNELHLILRLMRFKKMHKAFGEMVAAMRAPILEAAE